MNPYPSHCAKCSKPLATEGLAQTIEPKWRVLDDRGSTLHGLTVTDCPWCGVLVPADLPRAIPTGCLVCGGLPGLHHPSCSNVNPFAVSGPAPAVNISGLPPVGQPLVATICISCGISPVRVGQVPSMAPHSRNGWAGLYSCNCKKDVRGDQIVPDWKLRGAGPVQQP